MKKIILIYSTGCLILLYTVEQILQTPYIVKTIVKIPLFTLFPYLILHRFFKTTLLIRLIKSKKIFVFLWSAIVFLTVFAAAFALKSFIDTEAIGMDFSRRMKLDNQNMILAAVYTIFINSFMEEYFFRGFIFQRLSASGHYKFAYLFSSAAFAVYHVSIFKSWFSMGLMTLMLTGLFAGGLIFAFFVKKSGSVLTSWFIHVSADLALVLFGFYVLHMI